MTVDAVVVGSFVTDLAFRIPKRPEPGEVSVATDFATFRGGKGYNQAVALARLGASVTMIGAVGEDEYGADFLASLADEGVDTGRVVRLRGVSTALAVPLVTPDGRAAFVQYPGANHLLSPAHCADLPDCDVLLLQGEVTTVASERAAQIIRRRGGRVLLNPSPIHEVSPSLLRLATILCPNEVEARGLLARQQHADEQPPQEALAERLAEAGRDVVVTLGSAGAVYVGGDGTGDVVDSPAVAAVDATGAEDAFCAALGFGLAAGEGLGEAVRLAVAAAAVTTTIPGAEPSLPTRTQVDALLDGAG